jgi:hypothetical protein
MTRIIIAGSRSFNDYGKLKSKCNSIIDTYEFDHIEIVSGGAKGADQMGEWFAKDFDYPIKIFKPDWDRLGKGAGYVRNAQMAKYAQEDRGVLIVFWDGESRGSENMIQLAQMCNLQIFIEKF